MSKCNILPVMEPIIASNTEHGYLLSGVQTNPLSTEWLMNNFMHQVLHGMNLKPDMNFYPITTHTVCPCIDYLRVSKVMVIQKWNSVCDFLIENINNKYYVILHLDWFFISGSSTYQQKNYLHPVLIYGYNRHTQKFMAGDFNQFLKFTFFEIPFYEIEQGFKSNIAGRRISFVNERYLYINDIILYKNRTNMNYSFDLNMVKKSLEDYLNSTKVSDIYAQGDYCFYYSAVFGLNAIKKIKEIITEQYKDERDFSINCKFITVPLERTNLMLKRVEFINNTQSMEIDKEIYENLKEIYKLYRILLNMVIKCNQLKEKTEIVRRITWNVQAVVSKEEKTYNEILKCVSNLL